MTEAELADAPEAPVRRRAYWPYIVAAVVVGALWIVFLVGSEVDQAIRRLYSANRETQAEGYRVLRNHADRDAVHKALERTILDRGQAYSVRRQAAALLNEFGEAPRLEALLRNPERVLRHPVLEALSSEPSFAESIAARPEFDVEGTVAAWLERPGDVTRTAAVSLVRKMQWKQFMPQVRGLLKRSPDGNVPRKEEGAGLAMALGAVSDFNDCESLPAVLQLARHDTDGLVRMRALQAMHRVAFEGEPCRGQVNEDEGRDLVVAALSDPEHVVRMAAAYVLEKVPLWVPPARERLREMLAADPEAVVQRAAMAALSAGRDEAFEAELPSWFHAESPYMRSSAVEATSSYPPKANPFLGCLVGILRNERENRMAWDQARLTLHKAAGDWQGLPPSLRGARGYDGARVERFFNELWEKRVAEDMRIEEHAEGWFRWWAAHMGNDEFRVQAAVTAWRRFWKSAETPDVAGAEAALASLKPELEALFACERAWLATWRERRR